MIGLGYFIYVGSVLFIVTFLRKMVEKEDYFRKHGETKKETKRRLHEK